MDTRRSQRSKAAIDEKVSRMNAEAVVDTIRQMHIQMADFEDKLKQFGAVLAEFRARMDKESIIREHLKAHGSGATAPE